MKNFIICFLFLISMASAETQQKTLTLLPISNFDMNKIADPNRICDEFKNNEPLQINNPVMVNGKPLDLTTQRTVAIDGEEYYVHPVPLKEPIKQTIGIEIADTESGRLALTAGGKLRFRAENYDVSVNPKGRVTFKMRFGGGRH